MTDGVDSESRPGALVVVIGAALAGAVKPVAKLQLMATRRDKYFSRYLDAGPEAGGGTVLRPQGGIGVHREVLLVSGGLSPLRTVSATRFCAAGNGPVMILRGPALEAVAGGRGPSY